MTLAPLVAAIFLVGILPTPILDSFKADATRIVTIQPKTTPAAPQPVFTKQEDGGFFGQ
jgi:NADH:ubiquinone oxidoreductase subunit 4 (subunit M)